MQERDAVDDIEVTVETFKKKLENFLGTLGEKIENEINIQVSKRMTELSISSKAKKGEPAEVLDEVELREEMLTSAASASQSPPSPSLLSAFYR